MLLFKAREASMIDRASALPGREQPMAVAERNLVLDSPMRAGGNGFPEGVHTCLFGMGCFWGAERIFWQAPGIYTTAVGYAGGFTSNPTYEEVCSGRTGHAEVVLVAFDARATSFEEMLKLFWEGHDPTQSMRQGNDVGTQYRSIVICSEESQERAALASREAYQRVLSASGHGEIATEILGPSPEPADPTRVFYYAEDYHQQYLEKNPGAYCGAGGTGIACPTSVGASPLTETHTSD
jgi:peptide-methionine (S)-S-oxide reductase